MTKPLLQANLFKDMVNKLRDCGAAYHAHQSLRERISGIVHEYILPASKTQVADLESLRDALGQRIPERVIETLWQGAGISTYHPNGDQAGKLHQFASSLIDEFRFRLPKPQPGDTALKLLGEVRKGSVIWFDVNPHGWPEGTQFYAVEQLKGQPDETRI